ncbi:MAG TPA: hypothetical protein VFW11_15680 [Cyclobacteriaceae bacterium]|nr:hypothetical protein [Cyclobacteriaceae bacterium]
MIPEFESLNDREVEIMFKAPILVCLLVAGADGNIDKKEINEAISIAGRQARSRAVLLEYLQSASEDFEDKIMILKQSYPEEAAEREALIVKELTELNAVFPKISKTFAVQFYSMLKELALKVASSSGGWLGLNSVGSEEEQYLDLKMIKDPA